VNKGDIVLVPFPFTDFSQSKLRPAIVLWTNPTSADVTLCFITSQNVRILNEGEFTLDQSDREFQGTGLKVASKVRVTRIVTIERGLIMRRLGQLGIEQLQQLNVNMVQAFKLQTSL
jgi:mRNA interferase MazF